uniref:Uncharacterized protein n=1 Tax=Glossina pallidipes TaxID=7398 RepID=A0A1A9Z0Q2_GLOPL
MADYKFVELNDLGKLQTLEYDESNTKTDPIYQSILSTSISSIESSCLASIIHLPDKCLRTHPPKFDRFYCFRKCWINKQIDGPGYEDKRISIGRVVRWLFVHNVVYDNLDIN